MGQFRKKPVIIDAELFTGSEGNGVRIANWCGGKYDYEVKPSDHTDIHQWIQIPTLEGTMIASVGDYIIKGVNGEFYPCKPDIFDKTYEPVE